MCLIPLIFYKQGCPVDVIPDKGKTLVEFPVKDKMDVGIHEAEGKDYDFKISGTDIDSVHPCNTFGIV